MKKFLQSLRESEIGKHAFHVSFTLGHVSYFGLVFMETKYTYGTIAGGLCVLAIIGTVFHWED